MTDNFRARSGFTLIEILVVVGVLTILATVAVFFIDPIEQFAKSNDSKRVSELRTLASAVEIALFADSGVDATQNNIVYLSLPDTNGNANDDCKASGEYPSLPSLPSGWQYRCLATSTDLRNVDGTGWLPVNFAALTDIQAPLTALPIDPSNSGENYYAYSKGVEFGEYSLFAAMESEKYDSLEEEDGGSSDDYFETSPIAWDLSWVSVAFGARSVFAPVEVQQTTTVMLTPTTFVSVYADMTNGAFATAVVGNIQADNSITYGAPIVFNARNSAFFTVARLDASNFVVAYSDGVTGPLASAIIGTVTGNTISFGPNRQFMNWAVSSTSVAVLDPTHIVVTYTDHSPPWTYHGTASIGVITGNDISFGPKRVFNAAYTDETSVAAIDASTFLVLYSDRDTGNRGEAVIGTLTGGNDATFNAETVFQAQALGNVTNMRLDATHYAVGYSSNAGGWHGGVRVLTVSGGTVIPGAEYMFNAGSIPDHLSFKAFDSTHFVATYYDGGNSGYGTAVIGTIENSTEVSYGSEYVWNGTGSVYYCSVDAIEDEKFVISYRDNTSNWRYGTAIVGSSSE